jgi:hypothetical protein
MTKLHKAQHRLDAAWVASLQTAPRSPYIFDEVVNCRTLCLGRTFVTENGWTTNTVLQVKYVLKCKKGLIPLNRRCKAVIRYILCNFYNLLSTRPGFARVNADTKVFLYYIMYVYVSFSWIVLSKHHRIKISWVVLKIYAYIRTDSGNRLYFILCYDYD